MADVLEIIDQVTIIESVEGGAVTELLDQAVVVEISESGVIIEAGGGGVSDHGALAGLGDDDHPQYLNTTRGDARYDQLGAAGTAVAAHVAMADPHPQYLTPAEANAVYALIADLAVKAPVASPAFTGAPTAPTAAGGTNTQQLATTAFVAAAIAALSNSAPATLDTLKELADALGSDPNFATTITNALAGKAPLVHTHEGLAPAGGMAGQVLKKIDGTDYNYSWQADDTGGAGAQEVYVQQTRPVAAGPWTWWQTDATGAIVDLTVNDGL